jgi:two-component system response regulator FixJ
MATSKRVSPVVCVIDDDEAVRDSLHALLTTRGLGVKTFESAKSFLSDREGPNCHCLLIDMQMPGMTGLGLLLALRERGNQAPTIVITAAGDQVLADQVARAGAMGLLRKPVGEDELFAWIDRALAAVEPDRSGTETP